MELIYGSDHSTEAKPSRSPSPSLPFLPMGSIPHGPSRRVKAAVPRTWAPFSWLAWGQAASA